MSRSLIIFAVISALALSVLPSFAQDYNLPPGKWWENDRVVAHLELSVDQQARIKDLVYSHATKMVDHNATLEKAKLSLADVVERQDVDPEAIRRSFETFQEARRLLETERFEMLLSVRQVLTYEQWKKMLALRERLDNLRQRREGSGEPRPGAGRQMPRTPSERGGPRR